MRSPRRRGIETAIGVATANAVAALGGALLEYWDGGLAPTTKMQGGARIARLYELQQATLGTLDFDATARTYGREVLQTRHGADLPETVLDGLIGEVLAIVDRVTRFERAMAN